LHYLANQTLPDLAVELIIYELKEGFCVGHIYKKGLGLLWVKSKRNKFCGRKIAYTGHYVRPQGRTKAANWAIFRPRGRKITSSN